MHLHLLACVYVLEWRIWRLCLSLALCMEDYGWPITWLLSLINEDNELPLLPTNYSPPQLVPGRQRGAGPSVCAFVCVCVCVVSVSGPLSLFPLKVPHQS